MLDGQIKPLDEAAKEAAEKSEMARLLMTQPGVGPITSLAFVLTMGDVKRFTRSKQVASYLGLIPREYSSAAGLDQQAGQPLYAHAAGGSGASSSALRSRVSQRVSASLSSEGQGSSQGGSGAQVGHTTVLDAAHPHCVSRSRSYREQPAGAPGRQKLDRRIDWALSHPVRAGCSHRRIMAAVVGSNRWLVERQAPPSE